MSSITASAGNRALTPISDLLLGRGDPLAAARQAVHAAAPGSPERIDARILEASLLLCSRDVRDLEAAGWAYAEIASLEKNSLQDKHATAIRLAVDGDY